QNVVNRLSVDKRARPGRVVGDHPTDGRAIGCRNVDGKLQAMRLQLQVEIVEHATRFNTSPSFGGIDLDNPVEVFGAIELNAGTDGLPGLRRAAAACRDWDAEAAAHCQGGDDVFFRLGNYDAQGHDLVNAGIGGIEGPAEAIEADLALDALDEG